MAIDDGAAGVFQELRQQIAYEGLRRDAILERLNGAATVVGEALRQDLAPSAQERLTGEQITGALCDAYECVRVLVGSELDTLTPGERGLGRMSTAVPRFGGHFRESLTQHWATQLGLMMEYLVIEGFATAVVYDFITADTPAEVRARPVDVLFERWATHIALSLDGASSSFLDIASALAGGTSMAFRVACSGMLNATRRKPKAMKRREVAAVSATTSFLVGAGADLFWFASSRTDSRFPG